MQTIIQTTSDELLQLVREAVREELRCHADQSLNGPEYVTKAPATRQQAAKFLNVSLPTLDKLIRSNQLTSFNIGRQIRIKWADLEAYVNL